MNSKLKEKIKESLSAVVPITIIVLFITIFLVPLEISIVVKFFSGALLLTVGMGMFQLGVETAMSPLGEGIGIHMSKSRKITIIALTALVMGLLITLAEPDLQILSAQVPSIPGRTLILTVAIGVGICLAIAVLRTLRNIDLSLLLMILYAGIIIFSFFVPKEFLAVAFDSGGVTTGPITVPFIMAMGVGLSAVRGDKNASSDSFGLVALSSVGPIIAVMVLGFFYSPEEVLYNELMVSSVGTMRALIFTFAAHAPKYLKEMLAALSPIVAVFLVFQLVSRRYHKRQIKRIAVGFIYTCIGLVLFLCGVNVGFAPVGAILGREISAGSYGWLLIPIGMLMGYYIVKAEPAIQVLNRQVQSVTNGAISEKAMNISLSIGVSVSVGLAVLRIMTGISIQWILVPGYIIALVLSRMVPKIFVGIAFDSGGVASGPMTSTFLLPMCIGTCRALGGNIMTDAFGVIALVALTPLIAVQVMGLYYKFKTNKQLKVIKADVVDLTDSDVIVEIEEDDEE